MQLSLIVAAADRAGYQVVLGAVTATHQESRVIETLLAASQSGCSTNSVTST
ncbi:hypothetical protein [Mycobacterium sp. RTGN8]|uniref:hypothetical protein n=1 Tax=Mycobacterium sp. RTGN8 TaxID=3016520 RepID=UPI0029C88367|nr:hypothetical protein [Mycobacterium sp. RTGN8]